MSFHIPCVLHMRQMRDPVLHTALTEEIPSLIAAIKLSKPSIGNLAVLLHTEGDHHQGQGQGQDRRIVKLNPAGLVTNSILKLQPGIIYEVHHDNDVSLVETNL